VFELLFLLFRITFVPFTYQRACVLYVCVCVRACV
jgi:hypothetical protein